MRIYLEDPEYPGRIVHPTGYGEIHRQLILAFAEAGVDVRFPPGGDELRQCGVLDASVKERLQRLDGRPCLDDRDTVFLQAGTPSGFSPRPGRFSAGLTMTERESLAWYQERFDWVGQCNRMDLILTPSEWNRAVFERHGIANVVVTPLGVDHEFFRPRPVRFLALIAGYGHRGARSNWRDLVDCFSEEFRGTGDVELTLLTHAAYVPFAYAGLGEAVRRLPGDVGEWLRGRRTHARVSVREGGALGRDQVREVYRGHDAYVAYSREGWGFPALEAMACGLEVIACDYGAPMTYLDGSPARLFAAGRLSADNLKFEGGDLKRLRAHLREVYEERRRTRAWSLRFSWSAAAARILEVVGQRHAAWRRGPGAG